MKLGCEVYPCDIGEIPRFDVDCAFICTPTQFHVSNAIEYIVRGIPVFIEKPLTYDWYELRNILRCVRKNPEVHTMVGCNLRFHPVIQKAKRLVDREKPLWVRAETGYYLPWWRKTDYKQSYSASVYGGVVIDAIHEPDYLYWFFDKIKCIKTVCDKVSDLEIKREDISETGIVFDNGVVASVHCDYLMKKYHRKLYLYYPTKRYEFTIKPTNEMYFNEIKYFLNCLKTNTKPMNGVEEAGYVLEKVWSSCGDHTGTVNVNSFTTQDSIQSCWQTHH